MQIKHQGSEKRQKQKLRNTALSHRMQPNPEIGHRPNFDIDRSAYRFFFVTSDNRITWATAR